LPLRGRTAGAGVHPAGADECGVRACHGTSLRRFQEEYQFYVWDESRDEVRWMTSFDTADDVDGFAARIRAALAGEHAR
jgi:threonine aldolase